MMDDIKGELGDNGEGLREASGRRAEESREGVQVGITNT